MFCFVLFCFVLFCFVLFCFVLFCFVLFSFMLFRFSLFDFLYTLLLTFSSILHLLLILYSTSKYYISFHSIPFHSIPCLISSFPLSCVCVCVCVWQGAGQMPLHSSPQPHTMLPKTSTHLLLSICFASINFSFSRHCLYVCLFVSFIFNHQRFSVSYFKPLGDSHFEILTLTLTEFFRPAYQLFALFIYYLSI